MLNPALVEMAARDRIADRQRAGAKRSLSGRSQLRSARRPRAAGRRAKPALAAGTPVSRFPGRPARRADRRRAIGWFLVSLGLRIAVPRARTGSGR
jgi:hypothetical protein